MEDAVNVMEDEKTFCLNVNVRQVKAFLCESLQDYFNRFLTPFFSENNIEIEVVDIAETEVYEIALKKAIDHAKAPYTRAEIECDRVKSIRVFYRNCETNKASENIEYVRVVKVSGDINPLLKDGSVKMY